MAKKKTSSSKKSTKKKAAKKTGKKTATKKATKKVSKDDATKAAAKAMKDIIARARDHFRTAKEHERFVVADGRYLSNLLELAEAMDEMHKHIFNHHVNENKHDFATWVQEVIQEKALAEALRKAQANPSSQQQVIFRHIVRRVW